MLGNKFSQTKLSVGNKAGAVNSSIGHKGVSNERISANVPTSSSEINSPNGAHLSFVPIGINHSSESKPKPFQVERKRNVRGNTEQFS
jgi:hypothetical protein